VPVRVAKTGLFRSLPHPCGCPRASLAPDGTENPHFAAVWRRGLVGAPVRHRDEARLDKLGPGEEPEDLIPAARRRPDATFFR